MPEGAAERADPGGKHWPSTAIGTDFASLGRRVPVQWRADGQAGDGRSGDGELRLRLSRVGWHSVAAAEDAALPERWPTQSTSRSCRQSHAVVACGCGCVELRGLARWAILRYCKKGTLCLCHIRTAEEIDVNHEEVELIEGHAFLVAGVKRPSFFIGGEHARPEPAEEAHHGQVDLAMAAIRGGIDEARRQRDQALSVLIPSRRAIDFNL